MTAPHRFIVVDDDHVNNMICRYIIQRFDKSAEIQLLTDPEEALEVVRDTVGNAISKEDLVLFLDINMPFMNGWEFLEKYSQFSPGIHEHVMIYILSSSLDKADQEKAEKNRFVKGYYPKPLSLETLSKIFTDDV